MRVIEREESMACRCTSEYPSLQLHALSILEEVWRGSALWIV